MPKKKQFVSARAIGKTELIREQRERQYEEDNKKTEATKKYDSAVVDFNDRYDRYLKDVEDKRIKFTQQEVIAIRIAFGGLVTEKQRAKVMVRGVSSRQLPIRRDIEKSILIKLESWNNGEVS